MNNFFVGGELYGLEYSLVCVDSRAVHGIFYS